jgi:hypothetical protein
VDGDPGQGAVSAFVTDRGVRAGFIVEKLGTWRSLVSALVWGTRGRRFKSGRPDEDAAGGAT